MLTPQRRTLATSLLGFFIITLDALVVSVALPAIREALGGGIAGLQWVMDGYTLPFAGFLLLAGTFADRWGARRAFGLGLLVFVASSLACALAPSLTGLIAARCAQGVGAALMTPASLALIGEAYPDPLAKARAVGVWAVGGAVASASGPLISGLLTAVSWKLIFFINLPVGAAAFWLLRGVPRSPRRRDVPFDWTGQVAALLALTALTFGLIEAGQLGLFHPAVLGSVGIAAVSALVFLALESRAEVPMVPLALFRPRAAATPVAVGFTFMAAFYGMVFTMSLFLQEQRGLSSVQTGLTFLPVTGLAIFAPVLAARFAERFGAWAPVAAGQAAIGLGLLGLAVTARTASIPALIGLMLLVGFGGGTAMPSATSLLLNTVPPERAGTASGVLNTARQIGGALAIAVFGALIASLGYEHGARLSLGLGGALVGVTFVASLRLRGWTPTRNGGGREPASARGGDRSARPSPGAPLEGGPALTHSQETATHAL